MTTATVVDTAASRDDRGGYGRRDERDRGDREPIKRLPIPEDVTGDEIDKDVRQELQSLPKALAEDVAKNLVMVARLIDEDPEQAYALLQGGAAAGLACRRRAGGRRLRRVRDAEVRRGAGRVPGGPADDRQRRAVARHGRLRAWTRAARAGAGRWPVSPRCRSWTRPGRSRCGWSRPARGRDMGQLDAAIVTLQSPELASNSVQPVDRAAAVRVRRRAAGGRA